MAKSTTQSAATQRFSLTVSIDLPPTLYARAIAALAKKHGYKAKIIDRTGKEVDNPVSVEAFVSQIYASMIARDIAEMESLEDRKVRGREWKEILRAGQQQGAK